MIFSYLHPDNLGDKYKAAKDYTNDLTDPFPELERIARNRPKENIPKQYPKTTDGTTASIVRKTGKRVVQQLPTGKIESDDEHSWINVVAEFVFTNKILPYANEEYDLIQKFWSMIERGLTFGSSAIYTPFLNHNGYFCTDLTLPYWGDIFIQPGKKSGYACNYIFLRSWWQEEDFDALINKEKKLKKQAKERGEEYEATWDLEALEEVKSKMTRKDEEAITPSENELSINPEGVEVVIGFQEGVGANFYTFHPSMDKDGNTDVAILRTKKNKDPRGKMPIDWFYADIDGSNPLGRSTVDLIKGLQNLIDSDMQMYQYNRALMLAPPIQKWGSVSKRKIVYAPNAIIDMGTDQNNKLTPLDIDTTAVQRYPELYGLQKSQLLNLVSSPDTSISAEVGNPGFSKTDSGVKQQQAILSVDDNFLRKMFETAFENWAETAVNLFFAEREGVEVLQLDKNTADALRSLAKDGKFDPELLSDEDEIMIDYDTATPALKFRVDASTSKMKDEANQGEILTNLIKGVDGSPTLSQILMQYPEKALEMWNKLIDTAGLEDPENLKFDIEEFKQQQAEMQEQQAMEEQMLQEQGMQPGMEQPMEQPMAEQPIDPMQIPEGEVVDMLQPAEPNILDELSDDNPLKQLYISFLDQGYPDEIAQDGVEMAAEGASPDEVIAAMNEVVYARG